MSRIGMNWVVLGTMVALGCGGADKDANTLPPPPEQAQANPTPATPMPSTPPPIEAERMGAPEALPGTPATPLVAPEPVAETKATMASADIATPAGKAVGKMTFEQDGTTVRLKASLENLPKGLHGFQIRTGTDCTAERKKATPDFNPTSAKHGPPESGERHAGDLGNIEVGKDGMVTFSMSTDSFNLTDGSADSVVGKIIVVTARKDDGASQPSGNAGKVIACGKIAPGGGETPAP